MTAKEIFKLGTESLEAKLNVPRNFVATPPRLRFQKNWLADFW